MFELRPFQQQALAALQLTQARSRHLLCIAPTGSGKSLIYEKAASLPGQRTLLISPLVALARQQFQKLHALGLSVHLGAGTEAQGPPTSKTGIWVISPEILASPSRQSALQKWQPTLLVVDECHCLWEWGCTFRPAFQSIPQLITTYHIPKSIWLTATLPHSARQQLRALIPAPLIEIGEFDLPKNLFLSIQKVPWRFRTEALMQTLQKREGPGIIFVATRENTVRISRLIHQLGKKVAIYHGGLSSEERQNIENSVRQQSIDLVVATSAFGMGMDYTHLKHVTLWQAPLTLLSLVQIIGRVGRSPTERGDATVFWDQDDFKLLEWSIVASPQIQPELLLLRNFLTHRGCRRNALKFFFEQTVLKTPCQFCDVCSSHID